MNTQNNKKSITIQAVLPNRYTLTNEKRKTSFYSVNAKQKQSYLNM